MFGTNFTLLLSRVVALLPVCRGVPSDVDGKHCCLGTVSFTATTRKNVVARFLTPASALCRNLFQLTDAGASAPAPFIVLRALGPAPKVVARTEILNR